MAMRSFYVCDWCFAESHARSGANVLPEGWEVLDQNSRGSVDLCGACCGAIDALMRSRTPVGCAPLEVRVPPRVIMPSKMVRFSAPLDRMARGVALRLDAEAEGRLRVVGVGVNERISHGDVYHQNLLPAFAQEDLSVAEANALLRRRTFPRGAVVTVDCTLPPGGAPLEAGITLLLHDVESYLARRSRSGDVA